MRNSLGTGYWVAAYFILTIVISWGAVLAFFGSPAIPATVELQEQIGMAILIGPVVASFVLNYWIDGSNGLKVLWSKLTTWRAGLKWYALALFIAPWSTLLSIGLSSFFVTETQPAIFNAADKGQLLLLGLVGGLTIGLFEELGWTGFAVPRLLQRFNVAATGLIVGLVWGAWHFILFWEADSFSSALPFCLLMVRLFSWLPAYRILMVWVYKHTQSLLIVVLMHASLVASLATLDPTIHGMELLIYILIRAVLLWGLVGILSFMSKRHKNNLV